MMNLMRACLCLGLVLTLAGCGTKRTFHNAEHDRVVDATVAALAREGGITTGTVTRAEQKVDFDGRATRLIAPYTHIAQVEAEVVTRPGKNGGQPTVRLYAQTGEHVYTRHRDFERRLHTVIEQQVARKNYGPETKPTAKPMEPLPELKTVEKR